jgi:hypothetical protein
MSQERKGSYVSLVGVVCSEMDTKSTIQSKMPEHASKLTERSLNVHENKGSAWKEREEAGMS